MSTAMTDAGPPVREPQDDDPTGGSAVIPSTPSARRPKWWRGPRWYQFGLAGVALGALAVRLWNVLIQRPTCREDIIAVIEQQGSTGFTPTEGKSACFGIWGDSAYYYIQGRQIARGNWFIDSYTWFASGGERFKPSSGNPPMFSMFLGLLAKLGLTSGTSMRVATAVVGVVGVVLIVTLTRKLAGPRAAIVAGLIAAVNPMLWINDGMLLSETLYVPMILLALHAAYRFWERPGYGSAALFGLMMGLAALTRGEGFILLVVMVLPLLWGMRERGFVTLVKYGGITYLVGAACLAPWIAYNMSRFREPVLMTSSTGAVLSSANCDITYYTESIGYYGNCFDEYVAKGLLIGKIPGCTQEAVDKAKFDPTGAEAAKCWPNDPNIDESERDKYGREIAINYMMTHKSRLPVVMAARIGRMWDIYMPDLGRSDEPFGQNVRFNWQVEGRGQTASRVGLLNFYALWPFALIGGVWLWRRRVPLSPLLSMTIVITVTSAFTFGITRYRVPVDIMMVVMGAIGIEWILQRLWPRDDLGSMRLRPRRGRDGEDPGVPGAALDGDADAAPHDPAAALAAIAAPAGADGPLVAPSPPTPRNPDG